MLTDAKRGDVGFSGRRHHQQPSMRKPEKRLVQEDTGAYKELRENAAVSRSVHTFFLNNTETLPAGP